MTLSLTIYSSRPETFGQRERRWKRGIEFLTDPWDREAEVRAYARPGWVARADRDGFFTGIV